MLGSLRVADAGQGMAETDRASLIGRLLRSDETMLEAARIFAGGVLACIAMLGYAYVHAFHATFGLSVSALGYGVFDYLFRGLFFLISPLSALVLFGIMAVFTLLVLAARRVRLVLGEVLLLTAAFAFLVSASIGTGRHMAGAEIRDMLAGQGRALLCGMAEPAEGDAEEAAFFRLVETWSDAGRLMFVARDESFIHAAVRPETGAETDRSGAGGDGDAQIPESIRSYAIPLDRTLYCGVHAFLPRAFGGVEPGRR
jgi:hypothetical protein